MNNSGSWLCRMFISMRWVRQVENAARNSFFSMLCLTLARTRARGLMVSRFPRGACRTTVCVEGIIVTIFEPLSTARVRSSSSSSVGTSSSDYLAKLEIWMTLNRWTKADYFQEVLGCEDKLRGGKLERCTGGGKEAIVDKWR